MSSKTEREISPGDFPLGSVESRAAARAAMERRNSELMVVRHVIENMATGERCLHLSEEQPDGSWRRTTRRLADGEDAPQKPLRLRGAK